MSGCDFVLLALSTFSREGREWEPTCVSVQSFYSPSNSHCLLPIRSVFGATFILTPRAKELNPIQSTMEEWTYKKESDRLASYVHTSIYPYYALVRWQSHTLPMAWYVLLIADGRDWRYRTARPTHAQAQKLSPQISMMLSWNLAIDSDCSHMLPQYT